MINKLFYAAIVFLVVLMLYFASVGISDIAKNDNDRDYCVSIGYTDISMDENGENWCIRYGTDPDLLKVER
jgi:hypothetical protein